MGMNFSLTSHRLKYRIVLISENVNFTSNILKVLQEKHEVFHFHNSLGYFKFLDSEKNNPFDLLILNFEIESSNPSPACDFMNEHLKKYNTQPPNIVVSDKISLDAINDLMKKNTAAFCYTSDAVEILMDQINFFLLKHHRQEVDEMIISRTRNLLSRSTFLKELLLEQITETQINNKSETRTGDDDFINKYNKLSDTLKLYLNMRTILNRSDSNYETKNNLLSVSSNDQEKRS